MSISNGRNDNTDMKEKVDNCTAKEEDAVKVIQEQEKRHNMASLLPGSNI